MPRVMFTGNVTANAIGMYKPGFAFGTEIRIAAGTAIYEALAAKIDISSRSPIESKKKLLNTAITDPFTSGVTMANRIGDSPFFQRPLNFLPLVIPISNKNTAKNPLNSSVVKGLIPSACCSVAMKPMMRLPTISKTLPLTKECFSNLPIDISTSLVLLNNFTSKTPIIMDGASIIAIIAIICPPNGMLCISKKETVVTKVTALTEPYAAAMAPALGIPNFFFRIKKVMMGTTIADSIPVSTAVTTDADSSLCANS